MPTLLIIDDEASILHAFQRAFRAPDHAVVAAASAAEGLDRAASARPDVIVLDVHLGDASGLEAFDRLRALDARVPVVLITGHGTTDLAIEAMKRGAFDYLLKPLELPALRDVVARACATSRLMRVPAALAETEPVPDQADALVGRCPAMQEVYKSIGRVAAQDVTVLILGESGTGKELVARAVYQHSRRAERPFLAVNCAAIPEALLESELFGHEKGAFTGAERRRVGKFEQCDGGTLFLDEVGDMTPLTQAKVLRVLQDGAFERLGGGETVRADVRVLAATNRDLDEMVAAGRYRADLYFRLRVCTVKLPPLRERGDDLALLADYHVRRAARALGRPAQGLTPEALAELRRHDWPGNVRELQSVLKQALLRAHGPLLLPDDLPRELLRPPAPPAPPGGDWERLVQGLLDAGAEDVYARCLEEMERRVLTRVLTHTGGNQVQAARLLGINRGSLRAKIRALGITIGRAVWSDDDQPD